MGTVIKTLNFLCVLALNHCQFVGVEKVEAQDGGLISSGIDKVARPWKFIEVLYQTATLESLKIVYIKDLKQLSDL